MGTMLALGYRVDRRERAGTSPRRSEGFVTASDKSAFKQANFKVLEKIWLHMQCESLRIKVSRHLISRDSLNNCVLIETKYSPIIEEINAQVQMLLFIIPFW